MTVLGVTVLYWLLLLVEDERARRERRKERKIGCEIVWMRVGEYCMWGVEVRDGG